MAEVPDGGPEMGDSRHNEASCVTPVPTRCGLCLNACAAAYIKRPVGVTVQTWG